MGYNPSAFTLRGEACLEAGKPAKLMSKILFYIRWKAGTDAQNCPLTSVHTHMNKHTHMRKHKIEFLSKALSPVQENPKHKPAFYGP